MAWYNPEMTIPSYVHVVISNEKRYLAIDLPMVMEKFKLRVHPYAQLPENGMLTLDKCEYLFDRGVFFMDNIIEATFQPFFKSGSGLRRLVQKLTSVRHNLRESVDEVTKPAPKRRRRSRKTQEYIEVHPEASPDPKTLERVK
jgi:hypothetical protein